MQKEIIQKEEHYQVPKIKFWLRLWLSLFALNLPLLTRIMRKIIKKYLPHCKNCSFQPGFRFLYGNIYAENVCFNDSLIMDYANVYIGEKTNFSIGNKIITGEHDFKDWKNIKTAEIIIGKNVWITTNVTILPGVRIGNNSVIGAGGVVTRDIPPNVLAFGVPSKSIRKIERDLC